MKVWIKFVSSINGIDIQFDNDNNIWGNLLYYRWNYTNWYHVTLDPS